MALLRLPNELLLLVADHLEKEGDINSFARTTARLYDLLNPHLYKYNVDKGYSSALLWAGCHGQEATAQKAIAAGANLHPRERFREIIGPSPLIFAATEGHTAVVKLILTMKDADPNATDLRRDSVLSWAAKLGKTEVVKLLLATDGVNPNARNGREETPLCLAAKRGNDEAVKLLLATDGVDPCARDDDGRTALLLAAMEGHYEVVKLLITTDGVDLGAHDIYGRTALSLAAEIGNGAVVKLLLATESVDPGNPDQCGYSPIYWAATNGHMVVLGLMIGKLLTWKKKAWMSKHLRLQKHNESDNMKNVPLQGQR